MRQELSRQQAESLLLSCDIDSIEFEKLLANISNDQQLSAFSPDGVCQIDPRDGNLVIYNSARAKRVHTVVDDIQISVQAEQQACPICEGHSSEIFDLRPHSEGFSFINKNLYPIFHPIEDIPAEHSDYSLHPDPERKGRASYGFHLLQWTSSIHHRDWHNMPEQDALISFEQLSILEHKLLCQPTDFMPHSKKATEQGMISGYVSIIKNYGAAAGASLTHGHQQIAYSNILPQRFYNNLRFRQRNNLSFNEFMQRENPTNLMVKEFDEAVLLVPYFMRRPLDMLLFVKNPKKRYLHQLTKAEQLSLVQGIQTAIKSMLNLMEQMGMTPAYNMIINNGPGCGLYIEFLAKTQKMGGYEQIGLFVCQASPAESAKQLRKVVQAIEAADT